MAQRPKKSIEKDSDHRIANKQLGQLKRTLGSIRIYFATNSVILILLGVLSLLVSAVGDQSVLVIVALVYLAMGVVYLVGAVRVMYEPENWGRLLVIVQVVGFLSNFLRDDISIVRIGFDTLWLSATLYAAKRAKIAQQILDQNPDLSLVRGKRFDLKKSQAGQKRIRRSKKSSKEMVLMGGIFASLLLIAILVGGLITSTPSLETTAKDMQAALASGDRAALSEFFREDRRTRESVAFSNALERRGWQKSVPGVELRDIVEDGAKATVSFYTLAGKIETTWRTTEEGWHAVDMDFPQIRPSRGEPKERSTTL